MSIGARIREFRKQKRLTLASLAELLEVAVGTLSDNETGKTSPSAETIERLCRLTTINPDWLTTGRGEMHLRPDRTRSQWNLDFYLDTAKSAALVEIYGARLAEEKGWDLSGLEAVHLYLVNKYRWLPSVVRSLNHDDLLLLLHEEMRYWRGSDKYHADMATHFPGD